MNSDKTKNVAVSVALLSMISVQGGASIAKYLFPMLGPAGTSALRIGLAGILLAMINRPNIRLFKKHEWFYSAGYGICLAFMNLLFYYAIQRIPIGLAVTIEFLGPLSLALLTSKRLLDIVWVLLVAAGIALIAPWQHNGINPIGLLFAFSAGVLWAFYIVIGGKITRKMKGRDAITVGMCIGTFLILPFGVFSHDLDALNFKLLLIGLSVAVFSSALPYSLDLLALRRLPSKTFSILQSLQPVFGALSGLLFLGERLTPNQWIAILCIVLASIGATTFALDKSPAS
ncbi:MAG: DMT family transporter [Lentimicrobiaceae bacterium]|nr:DMT family transporter [Lentimicrobiaceae bacterium]